MEPETITTISPATGKPVTERKGPGQEELREIPRRSQTAFLKFKTTPFKERQAIVEKALVLLRQRADAFAATLTEEMGRPISFGAKEVATAALRGEYMLKVSGEILQDSVGDNESGFKRYIRKEPLGAVLVLFAWNYPWLILVNSLIPAILAGNTVILKPSPQTPSVAEQAQKLFLDAGLPQDVIQVFHCGDFDRLQHVLQAPEIKLVCFTGSVAGGLKVQQAVSSKVAVRVGLELGGKDPAYVRPDVDLKWAAEEIVDGAIFNSGQSCCSIERVYVHKSVHDEFVSALRDALKGWTLGDPSSKTTQIGPVISKQAASSIGKQVSEALELGAKDETPEENASFKTPPSTGGNYVSPRLLTNVTHQMRIMTEETFGPVIPVMAVSGDDEAVKLMNDSQFGLTASIWTKDVVVGENLSQDVEAGTVFVNRCDYPSPDLAWTGFKDSGKGQTLSKFGFEQFVRLKSYHVKAYPK